MNITKISINRPTLLAAFYTLIILFGILSFFSLNYELTPKFNPPYISVVTVYPGASAAEVEDNVSIPVEDAISSLENVEVVTTTSRENFSLVTLELKAGTNVENSLNEASRKLLSMKSNLPAGVRDPLITRFDFNDLPIIRLGVFSGKDAISLSRLCRDKIIPAFSQLEGVAEVRLSGDVKKEILVSLNPQRMELKRVSILQVLQAIGGSNADFPSGFIQNESSKVSVRLGGKFKTIADIRNLVIFENKQYGILVTLQDIASITEHNSEEEIISRINGRQAIGIDILKQSDANAVEVSRLVFTKIDALETENKNIGLRFETAQDSSEFTLTAAHSVMEDLALAVLLVSVMMLVFLHSIRNAIIVLISIPVSIITTFVVMHIAGYTLNLITLLGLSLAIGILVDDSIVVIENIYRHLEMGKDKINASYDGRTEIGFTALSITLIDVVVFLPVVFARGMVADLLRQFSIVITASTLMSLLVSFTLVPYFTSRLGKISKASENNLWARFIDFYERAIDYLINELIGILDWAFKNKLLTLGFAAILLIISILLIPAGFIGLEFTKAGDRSEVILELELSEDSPLKATDDIARQVESIIRSYPDVMTVFTNVGTTSLGRIETNTSNLAEVYIKLVDKSKRNYKTSQFARHLKYRLMKNIPGLKVRPVEINIIGIRDDDVVQVSVTGNNRDSVSIAAGKIVTILDNIPGSIEIQSTLDKGRNEINVIPDRNRMALLNVDLAQAGMTLRTAFNGSRQFRFRKENYDEDIFIILDEFSRRSVEDIRRLTVQNKTGQTVPFGEFSVITEVNRPAKLERTNRAPSVTIKSQVIGRPGGAVSGELKNKIRLIKLPENVQLVYGGATKRTDQALTTLGSAFAISILLVYLILVALYDSFYYPLVVLFSIPLAVIGALFALALTQQSLSIFSVLGLIMLVGLVGKNAILVVDFTNKLRSDGLTLIDALRKATRIRFRPVLMTNLAMIIGLLPIALASGAASEWKNGLAWALIGGLSSSMMLTLIIVPVVYYSLTQFLEKMGLLNQEKVKID
jgi:HAE1 family hydrophobic/amphiphilic exporter-1